MYDLQSTLLHLPPPQILHIVSEDAEIEPRRAATSALAVRHSSHPFGYIASSGLYSIRHVL
jgi:hypothetical protein